MGSATSTSPAAPTTDPMPRSSSGAAPPATSPDASVADNVVVLRGRVSSPPRERTLPSGSTLLQIEVTTRTDQAAVSVPVVWFDRPARAGIGPDTPVDTEVVVTGQVRRRYFRAGGATQSRTEVVATVVVPARRAREARRAIVRAVGALVAEEG